MEAWDIVGWVSSGDTSDVRRGQRVPLSCGSRAPAGDLQTGLHLDDFGVRDAGGEGGGGGRRGGEGRGLRGGDSGEGVGFRIGTGEGGGKEAYLVETGKVTNDILEVDGSCSPAITCIDDTERQVLHVAAGSGLHAGPSSFIPPLAPPGIDK
jgi:hypothetical protein